MANEPKREVPRQLQEALSVKTDKYVDDMLKELDKIKSPVTPFLLKCMGLHCACQGYYYLADQQTPSYDQLKAHHSELSIKATILELERDKLKAENEALKVGKMEMLDALESGRQFIIHNIDNLPNSHDVRLKMLKAINNNQ